MTGNSSGNQNNRLLSIIGRYKTTPWRGRYSLSRLFLNFYLLVMGSFVVIAFLADFVISTAVKGITDDYTSRFMHGTITLMGLRPTAVPTARTAWGRPMRAASAP